MLRARRGQDKIIFQLGQDSRIETKIVTESVLYVSRLFLSLAGPGPKLAWTPLHPNMCKIHPFLWYLGFVFII